eukprot:Opistho-2@55535
MEGAQSGGDITMTALGDPSLSYAWTQTQDSVAITVYPKEEFKTKEVDVRITGTSLWAGLKGNPLPFVSGLLFSRVSKDESAWVCDAHDGRQCIEIHLQKTYEGLWPHLMADVPAAREAPSTPTDPQSLFEIAQRHEVEKDVAGAIALLERAAERDGVAALLQLASMYRVGKEGGGPVDADPEKSFALYLRAAKLGSGEAHFFVGNAYQRGFGVALNPKLALDHYALAADAAAAHQYTPVAAFQAGLLLHTGSDHHAHSDAHGVHGAHDTHDTHDTHAHEHSSAAGHGHEHVKQDMEGAVKWWRHAASLGYAPAHYNLGVMCMQGTGTKRDISAARDHFSRAHGMDPSFLIPDMPPADPAARAGELSAALRRGSIAANIGDFGLDEVERRKSGTGGSASGAGGSP